MLMSDKFIHLHNHSEYSLLDGMLRITDLDGKPSKFLKRLAEQKAGAFAVTDHGNMYGAIDFYNNAVKVGIKPIIGCELYMTSGSRHDKTKDDKSWTGHITALVKDFKGYKNLIEMLSLANIEGFYRHPRIDFELLEKYKEGVIFLSGCLKSLVAHHCANNELDKAVEMAGKFKDILGAENFYLELMDHGIEEEKIAMKNLLVVAQKTGLKTVATNDCHYESKEDWFAHDVHICIATNSQISDEKRMRMNTRELYFKSSDEMAALFAEVPEALKNTVEIASKCNLKFEKGKIFLPGFKAPEEYYKAAAVNEEEAQALYLRDLCRKGLAEKCPGAESVYEKRLDYELGVIRKMGFSSYFLIVMDFIRYARSVGVPVGPGRGSGAGSLVAYTLDITRVDPIKNDLLFERFLNPDRKSMPDLDIDFSDKGREQVIKYVMDKYGENNVASIITYGSIMAKTAIKDVGRVLGLTATDTLAVTKLIPGVPGTTLTRALEDVPDLKRIRNDEKFRQVFDVALKIEGLRRHTGVHAAGIVITAEPVMKYVPIAYRDGIKTTQYDGNILTELGLLKVDFLGLRTLTVIADAAGLVREKKDPKFDIDKIPFDDEKTYALLSAGRTTGIFQLESEGMKKLVQNLKPTVFSDISALVALYRPGPIQAGMNECFVNRKHGREKIVYDHPLLEDILKSTYGTIIYQEQVMEISKKLANFTPGEADGLRKAMGKKIHEGMEKLREKFMKGCSDNKINHRLATKIFDQMVEFAGYGFNKSHSVAYAKVSYQTSYLKANYPLEFMTALLTSEIGHNAMGSDTAENKLVKYIEDAQEMGISILPPDVNRSFPKFAIEADKDIRFALTAIKNIGDAVAEEIVAERSRNGEYRSYTDFASRNNSKQFNKRVVESLAKAGAYDNLYKDGKIEEKRSKSLDDVSKDIGAITRSLEQNLLFEAEKKEVKVISEHELLKNERDVLGLYLSGHPLVSYRKFVKIISKYTVTDVLGGRFKEDSKIKISGVINQVRNIQTKKGRNMCKFELEDLTDSIEVCVFSRQFETYHEKITNDSIVSISGILKSSEFSRKKYELVLEELYDIYEAVAKWSRNLVIFFDGRMLMSEDPHELKQLNEILDSHKGNCPVFMRVNSTNKSSYVMETEFRVSIDRELIAGIEKIMGAGSWQIESEY